MSTATWKINDEDAELIACDEDRKRWNLNKAWPSNWLIANANQYDWAAFEGECTIICWRCAVKNLLDGKYPEIELFTYEESEEMLCEQCNEIWLGGFDVQCECCERWVWSVPTIHPETWFWGQHRPHTEEPGASVLADDGTPGSQDDRTYEVGEGVGRWVCETCLEQHYTFDPVAFKYTRKDNSHVA